MKTIHQLAKLARRLPRIQSHCRNQLMKKGLTDNRVNFLRGKLVACAQAQLLLFKELKERRVFATAFRCALPLKKQREILAANGSLTANRLLSGQPLAA